MHPTDDYGHLPLCDPDLPGELVPEGWLGYRAHHTARRTHSDLALAAEAGIGRMAGVRIDHDSYLQQMLDGRRNLVTQSNSPVGVKLREAIND